MQVSQETWMQARRAEMFRERLSEAIKKGHQEVGIFIPTGLDIKGMDQV